MSHGYDITEKVIRDLIEAVLDTRASDSQTLLPALRVGPLSAENREAIREVLAEELVETGLGPDGAPNERGRFVEAAIDWLGHL